MKLYTDYTGVHFELFRGCGIVRVNRVDRVKII